MKHEFIVRGDNFVLRPIEERDLEMVRGWRNQEQNRRWFLSQDIIEKEQQLQWYRKYLTAANDITFVIEEVGELNRPVGIISLYNIDSDALDAEFGRLLIGDPKARGKGIALKATKSLCELGFRELGLKSIYLEVFTDNADAIRVYEKANFHTVCEKCKEGRKMLLMKLCGTQ